MTTDDLGLNRRILVAHLSKQWREIQTMRAVVVKQGERLASLEREFAEAIRALEKEITRPNQILADKTTRVIATRTLPPPGA